MSEFYEGKMFILESSCFYNDNRYKNKEISRMALSKEDWKVINFFTYERVLIDYTARTISRREDYKLEELDTRYLVELIKGIGEYIQKTSDGIRSSENTKLLIDSGIFDYLATKVTFESEINKRLRHLQVSNVYN